MNNLLSRFKQCLFILLLNPLAGLAVGQTDELRFVTIARAPHTRVQPGGIAVLLAKVSNSGSKVAEGTIIASIDGEPVRESARVVRIRPGKALQFPVRIQVPLSIATKDSIEVELTMSVKDGNRDVTLVRNGAPVSHSMKFEVEKTNTLAGLSIDREPPEQPYWYWPPKPGYSTYELAIASRVDSGNTRKTASYSTTPIPLGLGDLASLDVLLISDAAALKDASSREAIERYLHSGGRVWAMVDLFDTRLLRGLMQEGQSCETIGSVEVSKVVVDVRNLQGPLAEVDRTVELIEPFRMKRVVQTGAKVTHFANGWPMILRMPVGYGELVISTLDASAWTKEREEQVNKDPLQQSKYECRTWANQFAASVHDKRPARALQQKAVSYPLDHIGNPVVPRSWVLISLLTFCAAILVAGCLRWVGLDLSWIGIIAPVLACVCGAGLLAASSRVRSDIPESVSRLQLVEFSNDGRFATVREQTAVHLGASRSMQLSSTLDGEAMTSASIATGVARYKEVDHNTWQLGNENWPAGSWRYDSSYVFPTESMVVRAELTEQGLDLKLPEGLPSPLEDPVLAYLPGNRMVCQANGQSLTTDGSLAADGSRWVSASLITAEQERRMDVYDAYFDLPDQGRLLSQVLYGWTEPWKEGPAWNADLANQGSALTALPVELQRPEAGKEVFLPFGLIRVGINRDTKAQTLAFDEITGSWEQELTMGVEAKLQMSLPPQVVPFDASEINLSLDIQAPHRDVLLQAELESGRVDLVRLKNPSIPWSTRLVDPNILAELRDGTLNIVLTVSARNDIDDAASATNVVAWDVNHLRASLRGSRAAAN